MQQPTGVTAAQDEFHGRLVSTARARGSQRHRILAAEADWQAPPLEMCGFTLDQAVREARPASLLQEYAEFSDVALVGGIAGHFDLQRREYVNDALVVHHHELDPLWYQKYGLLLGRDGCRAALPAPQRRVRHAVSCLSWANENYAHWLFEQLPRLYWMTREDLPADTLLLVEAGLPRSITDSLALLWPPERILPVPRGQRVQVERLFHVSCSSDIWEPAAGHAFSGLDFQIYPPAFRWLAERVKSQLAPDPCRFQHGVYLARPPSFNGRSVVNQSELIECLQARGIAVIEPGRMSFQDQVLYFADTSLMLAPSGAALANMLWMPAGSTIVVLIQDIPQMMYWFFHSVAAALGIRLVYFAVQGIEDSNWVSFHRDVRVDPPGLLGWLEQAGLLCESRLRLFQPLQARAGTPIDQLLDELAAERDADEPQRWLPLVSVCICAYNHEQYIGEALDSVLAQSYANLELIVVDDASTDGTAAVIRDYAQRYPQRMRVRCLEKNLGPGLASNTAISMARGEFVALLGSDDRMAPQRLLRQVQFLLAHPGHVAVFSDIHAIDGSGQRSAELQGSEALFNQPLSRLRRQLLTGNFLNAPSALIRTQALRAVGAHWPALRYVHDYELWCRLLALGEMAKIPEALTHYRVHASNLSSFGSKGPSFSASAEIVAVIVRFARECPLESLVPWPIRSAQARAAALLELAGLLEMVDYHYFGRPLLACAFAYELVLQASQHDADAAAPVKRHLEACLEQGFTPANPVFAAHEQRKFVWFHEPLTQLRLAIDLKKGGAASQLGSWLSSRIPDALQQRLMRARLEGHGGGPRLGILVCSVDGDSHKLALTLRSLERLLYRNFEVIVLSAPSEQPLPQGVRVLRVAPGEQIERINALLQEADFDWLMRVEAGVEFAPAGLLLAVLELIDSPDCRALCGDEMLRLADGSQGPLFRPSLNLDMLLSFPAGLARHWLFRRDQVLELGGFDPALPGAPELDLLLRAIEAAGLQGLGHLSEPLVISEAPRLADNPDERASIARHLAVRGYAQARVGTLLPGRYCIDYGHAQSPLVSILIAVTDDLARVQRCVESILARTEQTRFEILLLAGTGLPADVQDWLAAVEQLDDAKVRVLCSTARHAVEALNRGAEVAQGEFLVLLDERSVAVREDWLNQLLNHAQRPEVGAVGAKLLDTQGRILHAGLVLGLRGAAASAFVGEALDAPGYLQRLQVDQNYSAVSGDCLMIRRALFIELGGLDAQRFAERFADVDLCLRAGQAGYLQVWASRAVLVLDAGEAHMLQAEPERVPDPAQDALYERWLPQLADDPAYNANLSLHGRGFELEPDAALSWKPLCWRPMPRVLAHPADPWGCGHYRMIQPFNAMRDAGLIEGMLSDGLLPILDLQRYAPDVIVLQRQISEERLEAMRRMQQFSQAFKVYELDDYLPAIPDKSYHKMPKDVLRSLQRGLGHVDRFVVSTQALAEAFDGVHADIRVVRNRLPRHWWDGLSSKRRFGRKPRVGWAGGAGHAGDLELLVEVVKALAGEVEWVFFGMCIPAISPYVHELHVGVPIDRYPAALARLNLDLALAPLEDNLFNQCKSNLRLLEYGACGFPVVCSDVRCYREDDLPVTRVANRTQDWLDAIRMHLADLDATAAMGDRLREQVRRHWMLDGDNLLAWKSAWSDR